MLFRRTRNCWLSFEFCPNSECRGCWPSFSFSFFNSTTVLTLEQRFDIFEFPVTSPTTTSLVFCTTKHFKGPFWHLWVYRDVSRDNFFGLLHNKTLWRPTLTSLSLPWRLFGFLHNKSLSRPILTSMSLPWRLPRQLLWSFAQQITLKTYFDISEFTVTFPTTISFFIIVFSFLNDSFTSHYNFFGFLHNKTLWRPLWRDNTALHVHVSIWQHLEMLKLRLNLTTRVFSSYYCFRFPNFCSGSHDNFFCFSWNKTLLKWFFRFPRQLLWFFLQQTTVKR